MQVLSVFSGDIEPLHLTRPLRSGPEICGSPQLYKYESVYNAMRCEVAIRAGYVHAGDLHSADVGPDVELKMLCFPV